MLYELQKLDIYTSTYIGCALRRAPEPVNWRPSGETLPLLRAGLSPARHRPCASISADENVDRKWHPAYDFIDESQDHHSRQRDSSFRFHL